MDPAETNFDPAEEKVDLQEYKINLTRPTQAQVPQYLADNYKN